jgi:hypothetical protein
MVWEASGAINAECEFETYCAVNTKVAGTKPAEIHLGLCIVESPQPI